jgi:hypothetical protein
MRKLSLLFEIILENKQSFEQGLCFWISRCYTNKIICDIEYLLLIKYVKENRPSKFSSYSAFINRNNAYYWKINEISYRIKWLNEHIEKLKLSEK